MNYEIDKGLTKMGYELTPRSDSSKWESVYIASGSSVNYEYVSMYCFGKLKVANERKDGVFYQAELITTDPKYQDYVEQLLSRFKKIQPKFVNLTGYEIESGDPSQSLYYGKKGKYFVSGAYYIDIVEKNPAELSGHPNIISLSRKGNLFEVPITLNGVLTLNFIIDSGASDVVLPSDVVSTLIRTGTIGDKDFVGSNEYTPADGSRIQSRVFLIRELTVGKIKFENVRAAVSESIDSPLLLGQSLLQRLGKYSIDYDRAQLIILE
jgi:clan AA aspartic protease (TIGR02281 family)